MRRRALLVIAVVAGHPLYAAAQTANYGPYSTTVYSEGPGFRLGSTSLTLHPGIALRGGYDTNIFYEPVNPHGSALLRLRAHIDMATLPPQALVGDPGTAQQVVNFRFSSQVEYREYLNDNKDIRAQR